MQAPKGSFAYYALYLLLLGPGHYNRIECEPAEDLEKLCSDVEADVGGPREPDMRRSGVSANYPPTDPRPRWPLGNRRHGSIPLKSYASRQQILKGIVLRIDKAQYGMLLPRGMNSEAAMTGALSLHTNPTRSRP